MKHLLPIICLFYSIPLFAQHRPIEGTRRDPNIRAELREMKIAKKLSKPGSPSEPGFTLGTNFLSLFEPEGGPSIVTEYRFNKHFELGLTTTAILYSYHVDGDDQHTGIRLQPDLKYYFLTKHHRIMPFVGVMGIYKRVNFNSTYYTPGDNPNVYDIPHAFKETKQVWGAAPIFGFKKYLDGNRHHLLMEVYAGIGVKHKSYPGRTMEINNAINASAQASTYEWVNWDQYRVNGDYVYIPMGIKFGYRF